MLFREHYFIYNASTFISSIGTPPEPVQIDEKPLGDKTQKYDPCTLKKKLSFDVKPDVFFLSIYSHFYLLLSPYIKVYNVSTCIPSIGTPPEPVQIDEKPSGDKTQKDDQCTMYFLKKYCNLMLYQIYQIYSHYYLLLSP